MKPTAKKKERLPIIPGQRKSPFTLLEILLTLTLCGLIATFSLTKGRSTLLESQYHADCQHLAEALQCAERVASLCQCDVVCTWTCPGKWQLKLDTEEPIKLPPIFYRPITFPTFSSCELNGHSPPCIIMTKTGWVNEEGTLTILSKQGKSFSLRLPLSVQKK